MNILILGNGFCGSNLALGLQESEYNLAVVDKIKPNNQLPYKFYQRDIQLEYSDIFKNHKPDVVFYLISETESYTVDVNCFLNFLKTCVEFKVKKIIFLSSYDLTHENCATCNSTHKYKLQPMKPNLINQFVCEMYLHHFKEQYGINFVSLRASHVYGYQEQKNWSNNLIHNLISNNEVSLDVNAFSFINLIYIGDVVSALIYSLREDVTGIYNVIHNDIQYKTIVDIIQKTKQLNVCFDKRKPIVVKKVCTILNALDAWKPIVGLETGIAVVKQLIGVENLQTEKTKEGNVMINTVEKPKRGRPKKNIVEITEENNTVGKIIDVKIVKKKETASEVEKQKRIGRPKKAQVESVVEPIVETPKRKMGRPKKVQVESVVEIVKPKMGRPKKVQVESVDIIVEPTVETPKRKMGRPKKVQVESVEIVKPKMGRPKKVQVESVVEIVKPKMGRPKKVQVESVVETVIETPKQKMGRPKKVQVDAVIEQPVVKEKKQIGKPKKVKPVETVESEIKNPLRENLDFSGLLSLTNPTIIETPKKMGRPKKVKTEPVVETPKKMGRPKKNIEINIVSETPKKKIGRPKKTI